MSFWEPQTFREATAGRWLHRPEEGAGAMDVTGVSTDTRTIQPGEAFCALIGPHFDGHAYLQQAVNAGSPLLIVQREDVMDRLETGGAGVLLVDDTLGALGRLAAHYRRQFGAKVIAVTGTVGKTTTRQMIHGVLGQVYRGKASPHSFNNRIGVPLTLLSVEPADRYVVVEAGTSSPGEISRLARWIEPDIAIITHIGLAHTEHLGDVETIAREKASLLSHLQDNGLAIVNGDCPALQPHLRPLKSLITFGRSAECDLRLTACRTTETGMQFEVNNRWSYELPTFGQHNAANAMAAVAVARHMNLDDEQIAAGLMRVELPPMRLQVMRVGSDRQAVTIINDAYNANPDSMAAALEVLADYPAQGRRVVVLGDMLELGGRAESAHRQVGRAVGQLAAGLAVFIGGHSRAGGEEASAVLGPGQVHCFADWSEDLPERIAGWIEPGDVVLVKGSRGMGMERVVEPITKRFGQSPP